MAYLATGFDLARVGAMSAAVNDGTNSGTATVTSARYCHRDLTSLASVLGAGNYDDFPTAAEAAIDAILVTLGSTVTIALATGVYTITLGAVTTIDFRSATLGNDSGQRFAAALGFNYHHAKATGGSSADPYDISLSGAAEYVSNIDPYYYLQLARDGITYTDGWPPYEVDGQTKGVITTLGNGYGRKPPTRIRFADFQLGWQTRAQSFAQNAIDTTAPWTYEDLVAHTGRHEPIAISTTALEYVYKDRIGDFGKDQRKSPFAALDSYYHLNVASQFIGYL